MKTPPFKFSRRYFDLPEILATSDRTFSSWQTSAPPIVLFFLYRTTSDERDELVKKIQEGDGSKFKEEVVKRKLGVVPWLRNHTPDINVVFDLIRDNSYGHASGNRHIFLDKKGLEDGTCVISHYLHGLEQGKDEVEFARVDIGNAYKILCETAQEGSWFPDTLDEGSRLEKPENDDDVKDQEWEFIRKELNYEWPEHLPHDLKLQKEKPTLIALIHLSDAEIDTIKTEIGKSERHNEVEILNWPADIEPASEADMWHIFDRVRPDWSSLAPYGEVYGFFISSVDLTGPERSAKVILAKRRKICACSRRSAVIEGDIYTENSMEMHSMSSTMTLRIWDIAFNPSGGAHYSSTRGNQAMDDLFRDHNVAMQLQRREFAYVTNPDVPVVGSSGDLPVFVLGPITATQEYLLRSLLRYDDILQLTYVPNSDGTIKSLIKWFQSSDFMPYHKQPPGNFLAIDDRSLSTLPLIQESPDEDVSIIIAAAAMIWHHGPGGEQLAHDDVGYVIGRQSLSLRSAFDALQEYSGILNSRCGLGCLIEGTDYGTVTGEAQKAYFECFDEEDEELNELVTVME